MPKQPLPDLEELVTANIITAQTAEKIKAFYEQKKIETPKVFNSVLSILGALLVSLGIVLVVAHNWDNLGRSLKTIIAFLPLVIAQGLCIYTLLRKKGNRVWEESAAILLFFAVAACIALISQVYQIGGTLSSFLLTWLLLTFPLIYIMPSSVVSLLYIVAATWYATETGYDGIFGSAHTEQPVMYLVLMALIAPHYLQLLNKRSGSNFFLLHNWALALSVMIVLGTFIDPPSPPPQWIYTAYLSLSCILYLLGSNSLFKGRRLFANPFLVVGFFSLLLILIIWSFEGPWHEPRLRSVKAFWNFSFNYVTLALLIINLVLIVRTQKGSSLRKVDPVGISAWLYATLLLAFGNYSAIGQVLVNVWIILISLYYIRKGTQTDHLGILNLGLLIMLLLALFRFFDDAIPFIWRGLFFLATGAGFFAANILLIKKRKKSTAIKDSL